MRMRQMIIVVAVIVVSVMFFGNLAWAEETASNQGEEFAIAFLEIALILVFAKAAASLMERFGQPGVLGELILGVILGNLSLVGITTLNTLETNQSLAFLAQLGVIVMLFQVGLESNVKQMMKVGLPAFMVATVGVVVPFALGTWVVGPLLLPGLDFKAYLFLGAALTATSVSITARVFQDLDKTDCKEARIVLGAAVIDDVMGLVVLAVVSAIAKNGHVGPIEIAVVNFKAIVFLVGAIILGQWSAPRLGKLFSHIHDGHGMKFVLAISFCLIFAFMAQEIGLAGIVGAFAAGLVLDAVHFQHFKRPDIVRRIDDIMTTDEDDLKRYGADFLDKLAEIANDHTEEHVERLIRPLGYFLVPIFFVMVGIGVKLQVLLNPQILLTALGITVVAFVGKIVAGIAAGKGTNKFLVGIGMIPRGEVGLIFAVMGRNLGVVSDQVYAIIVIVVALSTLLTPSMLVWLIKRQDAHRNVTIN